MKRYSHSKLNCCLNNPMDYCLNYKVGMHIKEKAPYFAVGSAMHWGFENNTEDLTPWFQENGTFEQKLLYSKEQEQAEAMCHGYFHNKEKIMDEVLKDYESGKRVQVIEEFHELELVAKIKSLKDPNVEYEFMGIIDLLYLTDKGFIIEDYKSSRDIPEFDHYLDQLYRYKYLLNYCFPNVPIYKIGIINLVKSQIKKLKNENDTQFRLKWKNQYEPYPNHLINIHQFDPSKLDEKAFEEYVLNFRRQADLVTSIDDNNLYFINYQNAKEPYKSEYYDIYFNTPNAYLDFNIKDTILDPDSSTLVKVRDCVASDMEIINKPNVMFKYEQYEKEKVANLKMNDVEFNEYIHSKYIIDDELLNLYKSTFDFVLQNT